MPTTADYLQDLINQRNLLADNLNTMGVAASQTEKFNTLVPKVLTIDQNNGVASGTVNFAQNSPSFQISGLKFKPKYICIMSNIVAVTPPADATTMYLYSVDVNMNSNRILNYASVNSDGDVSFGRTTKEMNNTYNYISVCEGGFTFNATPLGTILNKSILFLSGKVYAWFACE